MFRVQGGKQQEVILRTTIVGGIGIVLMVFGTTCFGAVPVLAQEMGMMDGYGTMEEEWRQGMMPGMPGDFNPMKHESFATSVIPDADAEDFTFASGFLLISSEDEGEVFFIIAGAEDSTGSDIDNEGNELVLDLKVNGAPQTFSFDFNLDDGFGLVSDDLDLDEGDEVEVAQVRVQDPSGNTFGVAGFRVED